MRSTRDRPSKTIHYLYRCLLICLIILAIILIAGTFYGVFFNTPSPKYEQMKILRDDDKGQTFTGIGQIRVPTADPQPGMVILMVSFSYYPEDKAFSEELALRVGDFRNIIEKYIASFSISELQELGDEDLKTELLRRLNSILRLGKIETLYFSDFIIIR